MQTKKERKAPEYPSRFGSKTQAKLDRRGGQVSREETEEVKNKERKGFKINCVCVYLGILSFI